MDKIRQFFSSISYQQLAKQPDADEPVKEDTNNQHQSEEIQSRRTKIWKVTYLGLSFFMQFTAFGVCQAYAAKLFGQIGYISLAIVYLSWTATCLSGPYLVSKFSPRVAFTVGFIPYTLYVLAVALQNPYLLLTSAFGVGMGATVVWVAQGLYVTEIANGQEVGFFFSRFTSVLNLSPILGNLTTGVFLNVGLLSVEQALWILTLAAMLSLLMTFFVRPSLSSVQPPTVLTPSAALLEVMDALKDVKLWLLVPSWLYQGVIIWVVSGKVASAISIKYIPFFFLFNGTGRLLGNLVWGPIYDKYSVTPLLVVWFFSGISSQIMTQILADQIVFNWGILVVTGLLVGCSDSVNGTMTNVTLMKLYKANSKPAFAVSRLSNSSITGFLFFVSPYVSSLSLTIIGGLLVIIGTCTASFLYKNFVNVNAVILDNAHMSEEELDSQEEREP